MQPEMGVEFRLTGHELQPSEITGMLDLIPTRTWLEGESIQRTASRYKDNGWCLSTANGKQSIHLEDPIRDLLQVLLPKADRIRRVSADHGLYGEMSCVIYLRDEEPSICLSPETVTALSQLGAGIDIDIILTI